MPLKHTTETVLVFLLGAVLLVTGVVLHFLPPLPGGLYWWALAFVCALLYPLLVYPTLRTNRADYSFRALHFLPAGFLLLWLLGELGSEWLSGMSGFGMMLAWGLGLVPVTIGMALLALYCIDVIRQRSTRIPLLLLLFVPFALLGASTEWQGWLKGGSIIASTTHSSSSASSVTVANLNPSQNPGENQWRGVLRMMQRREQRLQELQDPFNDSSAASSLLAMQSSSAPVMIAVQSSVSTSQTSSASAMSVSSRTSSKSSSSERTVVEAPPRLVSSGPVTDALAILCIAAYCAVLQARVIKRRQDA